LQALENVLERRLEVVLLQEQGRLLLVVLKQGLEQALLKVPGMKVPGT
jgi:hypothetical protein